MHQGMFSDQRLSGGSFNRIEEPEGDYALKGVETNLAVITGPKCCRAARQVAVGLEEV